MGFIGSHLVPALMQAGYDVVGTIKPGSKDIPERPPVFIPADVSTGEGLHAALVGADVVIHLAAQTRFIKERTEDPLAEYRRVNVDGTRNVIRAVARSGVKRYFHMSSVKAVGEGSEKILNENDPCLPKTPYGISKLESEHVVREEAERSGMLAVVLRLPLVYGPGNRGNLLRMIQWANRGLPYPLFQGDTIRSVLYVDNAVAGILAVLKKVPARIATYFMKDRQDASTRMIYSMICKELGRSPRFLRVPASVVRLGGMLSEDFRRITGSFQVSSEQIEAEIGFLPPFSTEEGIARTVEWYRRSAR
jgi:nucleoside-diphosphate-sugar epimerase